MKPTQPRVAEFAGRPVRWFQPRTFTPAYELVSEDTQIATLTFRGAFQSLATGESPDGCWTFKRQGFIATRVSIRECGSDQDVAVFRNNTWASGGSLELPDGRIFRASSNFWQTRYEIMDGDSPLLTFSRIGGAFHLSSDVTIHDSAKRLSELPWLVMLGWYLTVMLHRDAAVAAG